MPLTLHVIAGFDIIRRRFADTQKKKNQNAIHLEENGRKLLHYSLPTLSPESLHQLLV